jgi:hypothetical protein
VVSTTLLPLYPQNSPDKGKGLVAGLGNMKNLASTGNRPTIPTANTQTHSI